MAFQSHEIFEKHTASVGGAVSDQFIFSRFSIAYEETIILMSGAMLVD